MARYFLFISFILFISLQSKAQFEREKVFKPCKDCVWKGNTYHKASGQQIFRMSGTNYSLHSSLYPEKLKTLVAYRSTESKALGNYPDALLDQSTNELIIDVRSRNGYFHQLNVTTKKYHSVSEYWAVYYDGGGCVLNSDFEIVIPFRKDASFETNKTIETVESVNSTIWCIRDGGSNEYFDKDAKKMDAFKMASKKEFAYGYFLGTDNYLYDSKNTRLKYSHGADIYITDDAVFQDISNLKRLAIFNLSGFILINTEENKVLGQYTSDVISKKEKLTIFQNNFCIVQDILKKNTTLNLLTGEICSIGFDEYVLENNAVKFKSESSTYLNRKMDPATCKITAIDIEEKDFKITSVSVTKSSKLNVSMGMGLSPGGKLITTERTSEGNLKIQKFGYPNNDVITTMYIQEKEEVHKVITLQNGNYAFAGRNFLGYLDTNFNAIKVVGGKMDSWRDNIYHPESMDVQMDAWKQNRGAGGKTAIDFLDVAENPNGSEFASVFIYHKWVNGGQRMFLGLGLRKTSDPYNNSFMDLGLELNGPKSSAEAASSVHLIYISDHEVLIACGAKKSETEKDIQYCVVDLNKVWADQTLSAILWEGKLLGVTNEKAGGLILNSNTIYSVFSGEKNDSYYTAFGKLSWNGSTLSLTGEKYIEFGAADNGTAQCMVELDKNRILVGGESHSSISSYSGQTNFYVIGKNDLSVDMDLRVVIKGNEFYTPIISNIAISKNKENTFFTLFKSGYDNPNYSLMEITIKK